MKTKDNNNLYQELREKNPFFTYESFEYNVDNGEVMISFVFNMSGKVFFKPKIRIESSRLFELDKLGKNDLDVLVFNMGMIELVSYWKAACPKEVIIKPFALSSEQVEFWKKLYYHGLGEFYYLNGITIDQDDSMNLNSVGNITDLPNRALSDKRVLVPIGGGKDSVVTLELLKSSELEIIPFIINPREASWRTIENAGYSKGDCIIAYRTIDPELLELNKKGYLNGHTPFSAMLAFTSSLISLLSGAKYIALSNESSANESTVPYTKINHQYSKSFEFETDFQDYSGKFLMPEMNYFSFLRPLNELQIARLFSKFDKHLLSFRSCNVGSKSDSWCGNCPKCLFTYIMLAPFLKEESLLSVFGNDLIKEPSLQSTLNELTGRAEVKPFECVGTPDEVVTALNMIEDYSAGEFLLRHFNNENKVPEKFIKVIKEALNA